MATYVNHSSKRQALVMETVFESPGCPLRGTQQGFIQQGPVLRKMVNPGLSQTLSKVFLSKNMQLEVTKYC